MRHNILDWLTQRRYTRIGMLFAFISGIVVGDFSAHGAPIWVFLLIGIGAAILEDVTVWAARKMKGRSA